MVGSTCTELTSTYKHFAQKQRSCSRMEAMANPLEVGHRKRKKHGIWMLKLHMHNRSMTIDLIPTWLES